MWPFHMARRKREVREQQYITEKNIDHIRHRMKEETGWRLIAKSTVSRQKQLKKCVIYAVFQLTAAPLAAVSCQTERSNLNKCHAQFLKF